MYSKNFKLSAFFCIVLYFALLISAFPHKHDESVGPLSYHLYDMSCPELRMIVRFGVWNATLYDTRMAASLLRLHYQDCFVNGCDASLLLDDTKGFEGEQNALPNQASIRGLDIIDRIKAEIEKFCPSTVSCADLLALVARDAVVLSGGPSWPVLLGRQDGLKANKASVMEQLPPAFGSIENIIDKFAEKGLDVKDVVALSGAHTIGFAHCFMYRGRLYNYSRTGKPDPRIPTSLLSTLRSNCTLDRRTSCNLFDLDIGSAGQFDNSYYKNVAKNYGVLLSDQALMTDPETARMVRRYSEDNNLFLHDFATSMVKLGSIGVMTEGGEIRNKCGRVN